MQFARLATTDTAVFSYLQELASGRNLAPFPSRELSTKMSVRIDRVANPGSPVVFFVSGQITGQHVDTLRGVLEQEPGGFVIDLKNVILVDRQAVKLLARGVAHGTELRNCPPYIREWVARETGREDSEDG